MSGEAAGKRHENRTVPPRLASWLVERCWPKPDGEAVAGDLDEEFLLYVRPRRGALPARAWYWRQALMALGTALKRRFFSKPHSLVHQSKFHGPPPFKGRSGGAFVSRLLQDLRYAGRGLRARPLISLVVILTLALGIGAATSVFSVVHGVILDPLPYQQPHRLIKLYPDQLLPFGTPAVQYLEDHAQSFEVAGWTRSLFPLTGQGGPEDARGARVFASHFSLLGARPALGRAFQPQDGRPGAPPVVILSHALWARRYGSDPSIVGRTIL
ncbi:MAG TPA: ABC transporter permease, partial [Acidobacteriota bacterium]|nr:ABC transporter permease [Acidobacteriota bacterium]